MKRTTLAVAIGTICAGLAGVAFAQQSTQEENDATSPEMTQQQEEGQRSGNDTVDVKVEQESAEIEVQQESPDITVEQPEPTVTIEQPEPNVTVEEADPNITVEQGGETEITVEQADDADVEVNRSDEERDQDDRDRQEGRDNGHSDRDNALMSKQVSDLEGMTVVNQEGEEVGDVQHIAKHNESNELFAIVSVGGIWGFGSTEVALPIDEMQMQDDQLVVNTDYGSDEIEDSSNEYEEDSYSEVDSDMTLSEAKQSS
ncbi:MAG: PRC-barrel domain-containing protein [Halomonas sp.]|nr:PRC-barrel domain-containing protein [Halomonas sp.]MBR2514320.1 PRC-barrel domain-containing protein [Halomonas sp.]